MIPQASDKLEFNLPPVGSVDKVRRFRMAFRNIGTNELERFTSAKIQQKWGF
jgi:hypothetical protein